MKIYAETERLILREILVSDEAAFFDMDSDPDVHRYLGNQPVKTIDEIRSVILFIRQQYLDNGIGRWALIEKASGEFVGWGGLKWITTPINNQVNFFDVGYRLKQEHWHKGYATESARASIRYGFEQLKANEIVGITHVDNVKSARALEKCGLNFKETFSHDDMDCKWYSITHDDWLHQQDVSRLK